MPCVCSLLGPWAPALACGTDLPQTASQPHSIIDDIFGDGFFWAVPKARRSLERRRIRRNGSTKLEHWATPRKNIKECLVCGHWHLAHTICGTLGVLF